MESVQSLLSHSSIIFVAIVLALYVVYSAVYRLYLSPIACFPGPRLAALTFWYEFYYDVVRKGRYTWKIARMHEIYGPVVRINPYELHVNDPAFYDELYVGPSRRTEKWPWSAKMFGTTEAAVGTASHELHRVRRAALNPFFSKRSVTRLEPVIQVNVDKICMRFREFAGTNEPVNLRDAFTALSADVIGSFAFGQSYGFLDVPDFNPGWHKLMIDLSRGTHLMKQFGWLYTIMTCIPQKIVSVVHPLTKDLFDVQNSITRQIREIKSKDAQGAEKVTDEGSHHPTILHDILHGRKLPPAELSDHRLTEEGFTLIGAGTVTSAHTLATTVYHLLANSEKLSRLRSELASAARADTSSPTWSNLEQLPYLSTVVSEGLRLSYGVSHRLPRVSPDTELHVRGCSTPIPHGTPVSMTQMFIHDDPSIFHAPQSFLPERWLAPDAGELRKYLVPFSRGARQCVGMNLAYAEIYLTLGALFKPVEAGGLDMEIFETDRSDVDVAHDFFNPVPKLDSKGVRVVIKDAAGVRVNREPDSVWD